MIHVPEHIRGLIFDCDGTLVDSMPLHMEAWEHAIVGMGGEWVPEFFFSKKGMQAGDIVVEYNRQFGMAFDVAHTIGVKHEYFQKYKDRVKPIRHVVDVVLRYKHILPMAVASGGTRENVVSQLEGAGIRNMFKVILTADDDVKPKPNPEIFLRSAELMGVPPTSCLVFEDGELGIEAAQKAGMQWNDVRRAD